MLNINNTSFKSYIKIKSTVGERCSFTSVLTIGVNQTSTLNYMYPISKKIRLFILLILIIQPNIIEGQETEFIYGKLVNSDDQTPIPFAHITI